MIERERLVLCVFFVLTTLALGCGDDGRTEPGSDAGGDGGSACAADIDCDDGHACTIDSCAVGGVCRYEGIDERCEGDEVCAVGRGCVDEASCTMDMECDDGFSCTIDRCGVGGICGVTPVNERCDGPGATCDPATGMALTGCTEPTGCTTDAECDDGHECTIDACGVENVCGHTPVNERCPDGETCTASGCFEERDCTTHEECDNGVFCDGAETCDPEFGCQPAAEVRMCADVDECTIDSCSEDANACVFACDATRPECDCPVVEAPCSGIFDITPVPRQTCAAIFGPAQVEYAVSEVEFSCVASVLSVDGRNIPTATGNTPMTQSPRAGDGTFRVETVVEGGCEETYWLEGSFTGDGTFTGTFNASYRNTSGSAIDECSFSGCTNQSTAVTGTRR